MSWLMQLDKTYFKLSVSAENFEKRMSNIEVLYSIYFIKNE